MSNIIQINNGLWGHRHKRYLQEHKRAVYITLLTSGKLNEYLADVDKQAEERFERLVEQMKQSQDTTEQLKSENALSPVKKKPSRSLVGSGTESLFQDRYAFIKSQIRAICFLVAGR